MKNLLLAALIVAPFSLSPLHAQSTAPAAPPPKGPIDFLTEAEKTHLSDAHEKAMNAYPKLTEEEQKIQAEIQSMRNGGAVTKEKIMTDFIAHRKELETDMLKVDPTIQPVLDKLHAAEARLKSASSAAAPAPPPPQ